MYKRSVERKGLIGDFDNTFVHTYGFVTDHIIETCQRSHVQPPSKLEILKILKTNPPFETIFDKLFGQKGHEVLAKYRETAMDTAYRSIDGGLEAVDKLKTSDVVIVIVSNRTNKLGERLAQAKYYPEDFVIIEAIPPKPDQKAYNEALDFLEKQGIKRDNIYIVGDSIDDYLACPDNLSGHFYAVTTGLNSKEEFTRLGAKPTNVLSSIALLPDEILT